MKKTKEVEVTACDVCEKETSVESCENCNKEVCSECRNHYEVALTRSTSPRPEGRYRHWNASSHEVRGILCTSCSTAFFADTSAYLRKLPFKKVKHRSHDSFWNSQ